MRKRVSVGTRLYGVIALFTLGIVTIAGIAFYIQYDAMVRERISKIEAITEIGYAVAERYRDLADRKIISEDEAKKQALAAISLMRFGKGDYTFVEDEKATMIVHPTASFIGKSFWSQLDKKGFQFSPDVIPRAIRDGVASVQYYWPRAGQEEHVLKIAVYRHYKPWSWMIASGVYADDIFETVLHTAFQFGLFALPVLGALYVVAFFMVSSITRPIAKLKDAMAALARGELDVVVVGAARRDEIGDMAETVISFKEAAIAKQRLEADAVSLRHQTDDERAARENERLAALDAQTHVVETVASGLNKLANGDLTSTIDRTFPTDYERLRQDFNAAVTQLRETLGAVMTNTGTIREGAGSISNAANELSRRTEQQAAALEQTSAALSEITSNVKKSAAGAKHANEVVSTTRADAEKSGKIVQDAVGAMDAIEKSSQAISQIIGVIDEIAFQTNLLALNAGVEAARAGDAGRGFAVVASEVRSLAQRSAEAAKEIKTLISNSSAQVASGVTLVGETGRALTRILTQVADINGIVTEIAASASAQAIGLAEVNTAINQMDQTTQQNAAMVEESTAASHALAGEAEHLSGLIGRFRVKSEERRLDHRVKARAA